MNEYSWPRCYLEDMLYNYLNSIYGTVVLRDVRKCGLS